MKKTKLLVPTIAMLGMTAAPFTVVGCSCSNPSKYCTIHFETDEAILPISDVVALKGTTIAAPDKPIKLGFNFGGWFKDKDTWKEPFVFGTDIVYDDMTLYAKWNDAGVTVTETQWQNAFDIIGDRTKEQVFSFDGTISKKKYDADGAVIESLTLADLIFNGSKHWYAAQDYINGQTTNVDVACEYCDQFFFQGRREVTGEQKDLTYKITDSTDATTLLEYIRAQGRGAKGSYDQKGTAYYSTLDTATEMIASRITFDDATNPIIHELYYYYEDKTNRISYEFNIAIDYNPKEIVFPSNWDIKKYQCHDSFGGSTRSQELKKASDIEGYCLTDSLNTYQKSTTKVSFYTDKDCGTPYKDFKKGEIIFWVGDPAVDGDTLYATMDVDCTTGTWSLPTNVKTRIAKTGVDRTLISILIKNMPTTSLWVQLE